MRILLCLIISCQLLLLLAIHRFRLRLWLIYSFARGVWGAVAPQCQLLLRTLHRFSSHSRYMMMMNVHSVVVDAMPPQGRTGFGLRLCIRLRLISNLHLKPQLRHDMTITAACWGRTYFVKIRFELCKFVKKGGFYFCDDMTISRNR